MEMKKRKCVNDRCNIPIITALFPVDHSRVELTLLTSKNPSDYINASFIEVNEQCPCIKNPSCSHKQGGIFALCCCRPPTVHHKLFICCLLLPPGSVRGQRVHCHSGSFASHRPGLLEDALGVRRTGTSCPSSADTTRCFLTKSFFHPLTS